MMLFLPPPEENPSIRIRLVHGHVPKTKAYDEIKTFRCDRAHIADRSEGSLAVHRSRGGIWKSRGVFDTAYLICAQP
jgi:hypothetical protein